MAVGHVDAVKLAALALLAACQSPFIPADTERITPPAEYRQWWEASRPCIAKPEVRPYRQIEWYVTESSLVGSDGQPAAALTQGNRVYLMDVFARQPWVIQHELVHAINDIRGHPYDPFVRCGLTFEQQ